METNRDYRIRRAILTAMSEYVHAQTLTTVLNHIEICNVFGRVNLTPEEQREVRLEWEFLQAKQYLKPVIGYEDYCKLSDEIKVKLAQGPTALMSDEYLYGAAALAYKKQG